MLFDFSNYETSSFDLPDQMLIYPGLQMYVTMEEAQRSVTIRGMLPDSTTKFEVYFTGDKRRSESLRMMEDLDTALQFSPKADPGMFL